MEVLSTYHPCENMEEMKKRPKTNNTLSERELDKAQEQFEHFDSQVKEMTMDRMNNAPKEELEPQTKLSSNDLRKAPDIYLKPLKTLIAVDQKTGNAQKFNEKFREEYNFAKEYVQFIYEHNEIKGEKLELWTRPFPGMPAEYWEVPANKPVWGPRYLAEQIRRCYYHRLTMQDSQQSHLAAGENFKMYGSLAVDATIQRVDARPVTSRRSVFMGAGGF